MDTRGLSCLLFSFENLIPENLPSFINKDVQKDVQKNIGSFP